MGTLHWVSAAHSLPAEVRLYNPLFRVENPGEAGDGADFKEHLALDSLEVLPGARVEESLRGAARLERFQFLRQGYFCVDYDSTPDKPVFNRTIGLRDSWAKVSAKG